LEGYEKMDLKLIESLNVKQVMPTKKKPMEATLEVLQCLASMEILEMILVEEKDMYRFIYNVNRIRRNTLPIEYKSLSKEKRRYTTVNLIELDQLLIIRVK